MTLSKNLFIATALVVSTLTASADIAVQDVLLRKKGSDINVRVVVDNPATVSQQGPVNVTLFVRPDSTSAWNQIKVWKISKIKPGEKVSRDLFSQNSSTLRNVANNYNWQAKATITAPGAKSAEKTVTNTGDSNAGK